MKSTLIFCLGAAAFASCGYAQDVPANKIAPELAPVDNLIVAPDAVLSGTVTTKYSATRPSGREKGQSGDAQKPDAPRNADIVGPFPSPSLDTTAPSPPSRQAVTSIAPGPLPVSPATNFILLVPAR